MKASLFHLDFNALRSGKLGISIAYGAFLAEAASYCLGYHEHRNPTIIFVTGDVMTAYTLSRSADREQDERTWADLYEATEYGAYGIGLIIALQLTGKSRIERSARTTGVDYWLGEGTGYDGIFQRTARLEISGILNSDEAHMAARLKKKLLQTERSDSSEMPAYVVIVDFGRPEARFAQSQAGARL